MIYVLIPVFNRLNLTIRCIESLKKQQKHEVLNIVVIDDGSTDGTSLYLKKNFPDLKILQGTGNLYWGGSVKLGIEYVMNICSDKDWILTINNDVELLPDSIEKLVKVGNLGKRKSLVGALSVSNEDKKTIIKSGTVVKSWIFNITNHVFKDLNYKSILNYEPIKVDFLTGRCVLHPVEIIIKAGNYDSKNFPHYGADDEFSYRVKKFGFTSLICPSSIVFLNTKNENSINKKFLNKFFFHLFSKKSSSNIINKFKLSLKIVPLYAKVSFFLIGVVKSLFILLRNEI